MCEFQSFHKVRRVAYGSEWAPLGPPIEGAVTRLNVGMIDTPYRWCSAKTVPANLRMSDWDMAGTPYRWYSAEALAERPS